MSGRSQSPRSRRVEKLHGLKEKVQKALAEQIQPSSPEPPPEQVPTERRARVQSVKDRFESASAGGKPQAFLQMDQVHNRGGSSPVVSISAKENRSSGGGGGEPAIGNSKKTAKETQGSTSPPNVVVHPTETVNKGELSVDMSSRRATFESQAAANAKAEKKKADAHEVKRRLDEAETQKRAEDERKGRWASLTSTFDKTSGGGGEAALTKKHSSTPTKNPSPATPKSKSKASPHHHHHHHHEKHHKSSTAHGAANLPLTSAVSAPLDASFGTNGRASPWVQPQKEKKQPHRGRDPAQKHRRASLPAADAQPMAGSVFTVGQPPNFWSPLMPGAGSAGGGNSAGCGSGGDPSNGSISTNPSTISPSVKGAASPYSSPYFFFQPQGAPTQAATAGSSSSSKAARKEAKKEATPTRTPSFHMPRTPNTPASPAPWATPPCSPHATHRNAQAPHSAMSEQEEIVLSSSAFLPASASASTSVSSASSASSQSGGSPPSFRQSLSSPVVSKAGGEGRRGASVPAAARKSPVKRMGSSLAIDTLGGSKPGVAGGASAAEVAAGAVNVVAQFAAKLEVAEAAKQGAELVSADLAKRLEDALLREDELVKRLTVQREKDTFAAAASAGVMVGAGAAAGAGAAVGTGVGAGSPTKKKRSSISGGRSDAAFNSNDSSSSSSGGGEFSKEIVEAHAAAAAQARKDAQEARRQCESTVLEARRFAEASERKTSVSEGRVSEAQSEVRRLQTLLEDLSKTQEARLSALSQESSAAREESKHAAASKDKAMERRVADLEEQLRRQAGEHEESSRQQAARFERAGLEREASSDAARLRSEGELSFLRAQCSELSSAKDEAVAHAKASKESEAAAVVAAAKKAAAMATLAGEREALLVAQQRESQQQRQQQPDSQTLSKQAASAAQTQVVAEQVAAAVGAALSAAKAQFAEQCAALEGLRLEAEADAQHAHEELAEERSALEHCRSELSRASGSASEAQRLQAELSAKVSWLEDSLAVARARADEVEEQLRNNKLIASAVSDAVSSSLGAAAAASASATSPRATPTKATKAANPSSATRTTTSTTTPASAVPPSLLSPSPSHAANMSVRGRAASFSNGGGSGGGSSSGVATAAVTNPDAVVVARGRSQHQNDKNQGSRWGDAINPAAGTLKIRGRSASGKRHDDDWINRNHFVPPAPTTTPPPLTNSNSTRYSSPTPAAAAAASSFTKSVSSPVRHSSRWSTSPTDKDQANRSAMGEQGNATPDQSSSTQKEAAAENALLLPTVPSSSSSSSSSPSVSVGLASFMSSVSSPEKTKPGNNLSAVEGRELTRTRPITPENDKPAPFLSKKQGSGSMSLSDFLKVVPADKARQRTNSVEPASRK